MRIVIGMALAGAALIGCATEKKAEVSNPAARANAPDWVNRRSGAFSGEKGKIFYGVGYVTGVANAARRRAAVEAAALAELGKTLDAKVLAPGASADAADPQALKKFSRLELSTAAVVDHWVDNDGSEFALAQLDLETFDGNLDQMKDLSTATRDRLRASAARAFQEASAEETKR